MRSFALGTATHGQIYRILSKTFCQVAELWLLGVGPAHGNSPVMPRAVWVDRKIFFLRFFLACFVCLRAAFGLFFHFCPPNQQNLS